MTIFLCFLAGLCCFLSGLVFGLLFRSIQSRAKRQGTKPDLPHYCINCRWCVDKENLLCGRFRNSASGAPLYCEIERMFQVLGDCWEPPTTSTEEK